MISIGEKIREARIARNLTQKELGNVLGLNEEVIINYENNKRDEFYKKYSEKAIAGKRAKTINSQAALKELTEVLNEVLVGRLDAIYNEREKMFQQGNYEEVQFRDYEIFKNRYLKNYKIKYYLIENERIPGLIKRGECFINIIIRV